MANHSAFEHRARKRFGQNFLTDAGIIDRIIRAIAPTADDHIIEIGPGKGAITAPLIALCKNLQVVEIDKDLVPVLLAQFASYSHFNIYREDALKFEFGNLVQDKPLRIVGNLPYNISTPLIFHLLTFESTIQDMHFMLQKEVVERLAAHPGDRHYGRLSVMVQYYCEVNYVFGVPPECFSPQPKVDSAIVRMTPFATLPYRAIDSDNFSGLVNLAFQQRRKTLRNTLKQLLNKEHLEQLTIDTSLRPEQLSVKDFVNLSNTIYQLKKSQPSV